MATARRAGHCSWLLLRWGCEGGSPGERGDRLLPRDGGQGSRACGYVIASSPLPRSGQKGPPQRPPWKSPLCPVPWGEFAATPGDARARLGPLKGPLQPGLCTGCPFAAAAALFWFSVSEELQEEQSRSPSHIKCFVSTGARDRRSTAPLSQRGWRGAPGNSVTGWLSFLRSENVQSGSAVSAAHCRGSTWYGQGGGGAPAPRSLSHLCPPLCGPRVTPASRGPCRGGAHSMCICDRPVLRDRQSWGADRERRKEGGEKTVAQQRPTLDALGRPWATQEEVSWATRAMHSH